MLDYSIIETLAPSISPGFYAWIGKGRVLYHGIRAEVLGSIPSGHVIFCYAYSSLTSINWARR
jgi:hypothetical protein